MALLLWKDNVAEPSPSPIVITVALFIIIIIINANIIIILCHVCLLPCSLSDIPNQAPSYLRGCLSLLELFLGVKICVLYRVATEINVWFLVTITSCFCWNVDAKDMSKCCPVYMLSTLVDLASQSSGIFFFFWLCFEGSNGNFYPRGFQIMVTGLFSLWSGWILFEA